MSKPEKTRASGSMTEAAFVSFVKSALRAKSRFWLPTSLVKKKAKRGYGLYECAMCHQIVRAKEVVVDHVEAVVDPYNNPTLFSWDDFIERLFCEEEGLQALCKTCHNKDKTKKEGVIRKDTINYSRKYPAEYNSWRSMYRRCYEPSNNKYPLYGGQGITVCDRWLPNIEGHQGFVNFLQDMGERPEGTTLDRIDGCIGYTPENCRWADIFTQNGNRSSVLSFEIDSQIYSLKELSEKYGINPSTLASRRASGKPTEEMIKPVRNKVDLEGVKKGLSEGKSLKEIADTMGVTRQGIQYALRKSLEKTKKEKQ